MALSGWRRTKSPKQVPRKPEPHNEYRCVAINCGRQACAAAQRVSGQRFLLQFVHLFTLPLPECDAAQCRCSYQHFEDRRVEERRLGYGTVFIERRSGKDRRENSDASPRPETLLE